MASNKKGTTNLSTANLRQKGIQRHHDAAREYAIDCPFGNGILAELVAFYLSCSDGTAEHTLEFENRFGVILASGTARRSRFTPKAALTFKKASGPSELDNCRVNGGTWNVGFDNASPILPASESIDVYRQTMTGEEMVKAIAAAIYGAGNLRDSFPSNVSSVKSDQFVVG